MVTPPKHVHKFRQSNIHDFWKCPEYGRRKHAGLIKERNNSDFVRGNAVHNSIEAFGLEWMIEDTQMPLVTLLELGERCFEEESSIPDTTWRANPEKVLEQVNQRLTQWYEKALPVLRRPSAIEQKFEFLAYEDAVRQIYLTGTPDWVEGEPGDPLSRIVDWKNPGGAPRDEWLTRRSNLQSVVYTFATGIERFTLCHLLPPVKKRNGPIVDEPSWIEMGRNEREHEALIDMIVGLAVTLEANLTALPQKWDSWFCSSDWCPAWSDCRGKYVTDDVRDLGQPILTIKKEVSV